ncbi:MAG TPA: hypothetical protein VFH80_23915 [Solirubrobacteraceae bacterium]|nr:hypothetical protein [Solirubrobacteraceae bacterium]
MADVRLHEHQPNALIAAGAFGGTHAPSRALSNALALLPAGAPVVFTIDRPWLRTDDPGGFRAPIAEQLSLLESASFQHRLTTTGTPIDYELIVAVSRG